MKILLTQASDWNFKEIKEIGNVMELKDWHDLFVIDFNFTKYMSDEEKEKYKDCDFEAMIYDTYIE